MAPDADKPADAVLLAELAELVKQAAPPMTPLRQREGFAAVNGRLAARRRRPRLWMWTGAVGAVASAAACVLWLAVARSPAPRPSSLTYRAEGGEILDGGYLRSFGGRGMTLRFSEGTELALLAGGRGWLRQVGAEGGHLAIEQGAARIQVTPRPGARWVVDAGPFAVTVRGTSFTVAWDAQAEQLDLRMEKGLVEVTGPILENVISVRGGQRLAINLPNKEVVLHELDAERVAAPAVEPGGRESSGEEVAVLPAAPAGPSARAAPSRRSARRLAWRARSNAERSFGWAATLAAGRVDAILDDVERLGSKRALAEASSDDLSALADAARYRRQEDLAQQALLAQRARFPGSARACDAAFLLGRLEESHEGRGGKALEWYDQYLEGAPTGAYASEALGRKMIATQKMMGNAAARAVAQDYLARFPTGSYAGAARALRQTP
jgi:ferric-dicitrate binding protein FerR (iron transport regulator)/TolA-binding protein